MMKPATIAAMIGLLSRKAKSSPVFVTKISAPSTAAPLTASPARESDRARRVEPPDERSPGSRTALRPSRAASSTPGSATRTTRTAPPAPPERTTATTANRDHRAATRDRTWRRSTSRSRGGTPAPYPIQAIVLSSGSTAASSTKPDPSESADNGEYTRGTRAGCRNRGTTSDAKMGFGNLTRAAEASDGQRDRLFGVVTVGGQLLDAFTSSGLPPQRRRRLVGDARRQLVGAARSGSRQSCRRRPWSFPQYVVDRGEEPLPGTPLLGEMGAALPGDFVGSASSPVHPVPLAGDQARLPRAGGAPDTPCRPEDRRPRRCVHATTR